MTISMFTKAMFQRIISREVFEGYRFRSYQIRVGGIFVSLKTNEINIYKQHNNITNQSLGYRLMGAAEAVLQKSELQLLKELVEDFIAHEGPGKYVFCKIQFSVIILLIIVKQFCF